MNRESDITKAIRRTLDILGIPHFKHWGGPMSEKGVADIIGSYNGRFLAIEVKVPGRRLTAHQAAFLDRYSRDGAICFMATCVEDVIDRLDVRDKFLV